MTARLSRKGGAALEAAHGLASQALDAGEHAGEAIAHIRRAEADGTGFARPCRGLHRAAR